MCAYVLRYMYVKGEERGGGTEVVVGRNPAGEVLGRNLRFVILVEAAIGGDAARVWESARNICFD